MNGRRVRTSAAEVERVKIKGDVAVTTNNTAPARHVHGRVALGAVAALLSIGLAGCESSSSLFGSDNATKPEAAVAQAPKVQAPTQQAKVAIAPVIGAPDGIAKQMSEKLGESLEKQRIGVAKAQGEQTDYTVRGYVVAAKEKTGTKVSYIWDVTDPSGKRVNRVTGEEIAGGAAGGKDPWAAVTPQLVQTISEKTAGSLAAWVPTQKGGAAGVPIATNSTGPAAAPVQTASTNTARSQPAGATGSIGRDGGSVAAITSVTGAPGDGSSSLAAALQRELSKNGVAMGAATAPAAHKIEGKVKVGEAKDGKQPIQIDWTVRDAATGKSKGTVSQKNEIPQGSLDGSWGQTADAAAAAAAQGIIKLLPKTN